ncbi:MAG: hypothetical protein HFE81_07880 [Bacilli bacterium]|nr:hypothetical protein [Bacilli bacterium]
MKKLGRSDKMAEFKVFKNGDFTVMSNYHLKDSSLSLKAVGLMSKMLSLPETWDYSLAGLVAICKEGKDTVRTTLNELKSHDYIEILRLRTSKGTFKYKYLIFENPFEKAIRMPNQPDMKKPYMDGPDVEFSTQSNINNLNDKDDKKDSKTIKHNILTDELINLNYIEEDEASSFYFDNLFERYIRKGHKYYELFNAIHYIVPRIISRNYIDEEGKDITNKYGYFKVAIESNFQKLANLHSQSENENFWDSFEL